MRRISPWLRKVVRREWVPVEDAWVETLSCGHVVYRRTVISFRRVRITAVCDVCKLEASRR